MRHSLHSIHPLFFHFFFFNDTATTEIYTLSLHDALPICGGQRVRRAAGDAGLHRTARRPGHRRSEEHTSELQSQSNLVCRLLLEKKKKRQLTKPQTTTTTPESRIRAHSVFDACVHVLPTG